MLFWSTSSDGVEAWSWSLKGQDVSDAAGSMQNAFNTKLSLCIPPLTHTRETCISRTVPSTILRSAMPFLTPCSHLPMAQSKLLPHHVAQKATFVPFYAPPRLPLYRASFYGSLMTQLGDARAYWTETLWGHAPPPRLNHSRPKSLDRQGFCVQNEEGGLIRAV
jgi:hypothetical protein